jgi:hypothetical protein
MLPPPADRRIDIPRTRVARAFDLALAGTLALVLSAVLLAPGLADPDPGQVCAATLSGQPQGCGPQN